MTAAVIVAAGAGTRMGFDKLLAPLAGTPVLRHTLNAFQLCPDIDGFWIVVSPSSQNTVLALAADFPKFRGLVPGGPERHLSVWNGLSALPPDTDCVAVHDGARPLIRPGQISRCIAAARLHGAAASARRITDTLKRADPDGRVTASVDRDHLWAMETPQVFRFPLLHAAYQKVLQNGTLVTDEVSAATLSDIPVWLVENHSPNLKITLPGDLETAAALLP